MPTAIWRLLLRSETAHCDLAKWSQTVQIHWRSEGGWLMRARHAGPRCKKAHGGTGWQRLEGPDQRRYARAAGDRREIERRPLSIASSLSKLILRQSLSLNKSLKTMKTAGAAWAPNWAVWEPPCLWITDGHRSARFKRQGC